MSKPIPKTKNTEDYRKTHLCPRCKYRSDISGGDGYGYNVHCNYAGPKEKWKTATALRNAKHGETIDTRGEDRGQCKLFVEGNPDKNISQKRLFKPKSEDIPCAYNIAWISRWENGGR